MKASLQAAITKVTTMRDRTIRLQVDVQEIHPDHMAELFALNDKLGHFFFAEQAIREIPKDLPEVVLEKNEKSPATRLRNVLYLLHKQSGGADHDFDAYYRKSVERVIETVKEKLN